MEQMRREENIEPQQDGQQMQVRAHENRRPQPPAQSCPRCGSSETRFCYYNNYNLSQPRYYCMACERYWTQGGALRDIPIGSGSRKNKRSSTSDVARAAHSLPTILPPPQNYAGVIMGPPSRALPPVMPPIYNSFFGGGALFTSSSIQTIPTGITQGVVVEGGGRCMAQFLETSLPLLRPQVPQQFQPQNNYFLSQESMMLPRPVVSWTQSLITSMASDSVASSWSGDNVFDIVDDGDHDDFSFSLNHEWFTSPDRYPEFGPP